jgi:hypothetical protein
VALSEQEIIDFALQHYGTDRRALLPLLLRHIEDDSSTMELYEAIMEAIDRPMHVRSGGSEEMHLDVIDGNPDLTSLGDTSDYYWIVLNPEIEEVTDWDFAKELQGGMELHTIALWVNWFLPVYFLQCQFNRGWGKFWSQEHGILESLDAEEQQVLGKLYGVLSRFGYQSLRKEFLQQRILGLASDIYATHASLYECLFSDCNYPTENNEEDKQKWGRKF